MSSETGTKTAYLFGIVVVSIAVTGYFIGLQSPMNPALDADKTADSSHDLVESIHTMTPPTDESGAVLAAAYADMQSVTRNRAAQLRTSLVDLKPTFDPMAEVVINAGQLNEALARRQINRAFNGAPPTVPHPVDQMSTTACIVCHGEGIATATFRISKMSHQFLENCTQCHVENSPTHLPATLFRESDFVGLPAPTGGPRAFEGAPPMIPHSTWMRVECTSCHGYAGLQGIRTTHPWRHNCQQCHAPSSTLDQVQLNSEPQFLVPPGIEK